MVTDGYMTREGAAGYQRLTIRLGKALLAGVGAGGGNLAQTLALLGVGDVLVGDCDQFEPSNSTRTPLYPTQEDQARWGPGKAKVVAHRMGEIARNQVAMPIRPRYFHGYVQQLPMAVFRHVDVVINGSDNLMARTYLAEMAFMAGKPIIDAGFRGDRLQMGVFVPGDPEKDPCWRCANPEIAPGTREYGCSWYARAAEEQGMVPAVQPVAQTAAGLVAHHTVLALQKEFPLENSMIHLNARDGSVVRYRVSRMRQCPSQWHHLGGRTPLPVPWHAEMTWQELLDHAEDTLGAEAGLKPLTRLVWNMPCRACREFMSVRSSSWLFEAKPYCRNCGGPFPRLTGEEASSIAVEEWYDWVDFTTPDLLPRRLADAGLRAEDLIIAQALESREEVVLLLDGDLGPVVAEFFHDADFDDDRSVGGEIGTGATS